MAEKLIDIGKIVRNTTKMNLKNGDMEEIVNLRHEDGKWKPLPENVRIWESISGGDKIIDDYTQLFIHTGKMYKHLLGVRKSTFVIDYIGNIENDDVIINDASVRNTAIIVSKEKVECHQIGNLLIISDTKRVQFLQWKDNKEYVQTNIDYNGSQWDTKLNPIGNIKMRVKPVTNDAGVPQLLLTPSKLDDSSDCDTWEGCGFNEQHASNNGLSCIAQVRKAAKELGYMNGFAVAVVALELYDGTYAYTSAPIIIPQANDDGTRYHTTRGYERALTNSNASIVKTDAKNGGDTLASAYDYMTNPKAMDIIRPERPWAQMNKVYDGIKTLKGTNEELNMSYGYKTKANMRYGMFNTRGDEATDAGSSSYATIDLFGIKERVDDKTIEPYSFNEYIFDESKDYDAFEYADQYVTMRSSSCCEQMTTKARFDQIKDRRLFNETCAIMHPDCFNPPNSFSIMGTISQAGTSRMHLSSCERIGDEHTCWGVLAGQTLQINIGDSYNENLTDIIKNVCVFMSSEVYYADEYNNTSDLIETYEVMRTGSKSNARTLKHSGYTVYAKPKKNEEIKKQLQDTAVLYKIYTTPYSQTRTNEWLDIDVTDKLNILEEQETLSVDSSYQRLGLSAECSYLYNGRLHLGNITENKFSGYPLREFEIPEQWSLKAKSKHSRAPYAAKTPDNYKRWFTFAEGESYAIKIGKEEYAVYEDDDYSFVSIDGREYSAIKGGYKFKYNGKQYYCDESNIVYSEDDSTITISVTKGSSVSITVTDGATTAEATDISGIRYFVEITSTDGDNDVTKIYEAYTTNSFSGDVTTRNGVIEPWYKKDKPSVKASFMNEYVASRDYYEYEVCKQWGRTAKVLPANTIAYVIVELKTDNGRIRVARLDKRDDGIFYPINPMLSYPDSRAENMIIGYVSNKKGDVITCEESVFELKPFKALESAVFISTDVKPIEWWRSMTDEEQAEKGYTHKRSIYQIGRDSCPFMTDSSRNIIGINEIGVTAYRPNVLKVSATESPLFFPSEYTYQIGNGEIRSLMANTVALSTGQWGDAPLYAFCSDGIYGMFVDATGQTCYPNSRPISRDVCNNAIGVLPIDDAVVYPTNRGLFLISGATTDEISVQAEGKPLAFTTGNKMTNSEYLNSMRLVVNQDANGGAWLNIPYAPTDEDFKEYIKEAVCGWNYTHTELWVSNPNKRYTYIYSESGWTKVMRQIEYYINDYPRTYAVEVVDGERVVIDIENNEETPTDCFFVTRPILIEGESAKTFTRAWLYGDFRVADNGEDAEHRHKASILVYGSHDGNKFGLIGVGGVKGRSRNILAKLHRMSMRYVRIAFAGRVYPDSVLECMGLEVKASWGEDSTRKVR